MQWSSWDLAAVAIKTLLYAATFGAAGGVLFLLYSARLIPLDSHRRIRQWVALCIGVALAASAVRILIVAGSMGEGAAGLFDGAMMRMVLQAGEGRATGIRIAGLFLAATVLPSASRLAMLAAVGAILAATSFAWIGHAWAAPTAGTSVALLSLHLLGVGFWLGALVPLLMLGRGQDLARFAGAAKRFGDIALYGVAALLIVGALLLATFLRRFSELWTTDYGRLMTLKLAGVAALLGAAAFNKRRLTPRLLTHPAAARQLCRTIQLEIALGLTVLAVTATLTTLLGPPILE